MPTVKATMWRSRKTLSTSIVTPSYVDCYLVIAVLALSIIVYVFLIVNEKQMQIAHDIDRTRMLRKKASEGKAGGNVLHARERESLADGRKFF
jgi:hypothetical protein